jgi:hypothetical protein
MGNRVSSGHMSHPLGNLSWGRRKEDTVKLEDFLAKQEEDLLAVPKHGCAGNKLQHLVRSSCICYVHLPIPCPQTSRFCLNRGEMRNPAFVEDCLPWTAIQ